MGLPIHIDPRKLAMQISRLEGCVDASKLPRLVAAVNSISGDATATLNFENEHARAALVDGEVNIKVEIHCQRCLDPVAVELQTAFALQVISGEEYVDRVATSREPWIVEDRMANLHQMLEDELLLVLPAVNYHPAGTCTGDTFMTHREPDEVVESPFNVLRSLKTRT
jgi:uncharacterized protein